MKVGDPYVGKDGQWYFRTEKDVMEYVDLKDNLNLAYEQGSTDAYYGKIKLSLRKDTPYNKYTTEEKQWYWKGYGDAIFGEKDYD